VALVWFSRLRENESGDVIAQGTSDSFPEMTLLINTLRDRSFRSVAVWTPEMQSPQLLSLIVRDLTGMLQ